MSNNTPDMEPQLIPEVYQDGSCFFHDTTGFIAQIGGKDLKDFDIEGAVECRKTFAKLFPQYVKKD